MTSLQASDPVTRRGGTDVREIVRDVSRADRPVRAARRPKGRRRLGPSAHVDTFARDNLPPAEQWPDLLLDRPEFQYPEYHATPPSS